MDRRLATINIIIAVADTIVCLATVCIFGFLAWHFGKWWISLFNLVPLALFNSHSIIINADLAAAQEEGENDS